MQNTKTLIDMRIAQGIQGIPYGQIKLVRGVLATGAPDYALFADNEYLGSVDGVINEQQAVLVGVGKIRELLALLSE